MKSVYGTIVSRLALFTGAILILFSCNSDSPVSAVPPTNQPLKDFVLTSNAVPGWTAPDSNVAYFDSLNLFNLIDGGSVPYIQGGLDTGVRQSLKHDSTLFGTVMAMDFVTAQKAAAIFGFEAQDNNATAQLAGFTKSDALCYVFYGGVIAFAHFGKYYFNVKLSGYSDSASSVNDAARFVMEYKSRVK
jgi:hypothetical protein